MYQYHLNPHIQLTIEDTKSLRLTCRHLASALSSLIFRNITINIFGSDVYPSLSKLAALAQPNHPAHQEARYLKIFSLSPLALPKRTTSICINGAWHPNVNEIVDSEEFMRIGQTIRANIDRAISALKGVQQVL